MERERAARETASILVRLMTPHTTLDAIKLYRGAHGVDLKDAKDAVEAIAAEMLRKGEISQAASLSRDAGFRRMQLGFVLALALLFSVAAAILAFVMVR